MDIAMHQIFHCSILWVASVEIFQDTILECRWNNDAFPVGLGLYALMAYREEIRSSLVLFKNFRFYLESLLFYLFKRHWKFPCYIRKSSF